jgi:hypothetical protein
MKKYTAKQLTKYAESIGFINPNVWYSKMDGWWLDCETIEEYLGVWSSEAKNRIYQLFLKGYHKK